MADIYEKELPIITSLLNGASIRVVDGDDYSKLISKDDLFNAIRAEVASLATTLLAGLMSSSQFDKVEATPIFDATALAPDPYMVTTRGGSKGTIVEGSPTTPVASEQATISVHKYSDTNDGEILWSKGDVGAGSFTTVKYGNGTTTGTAHLISLSGSALRYGGTNNCVGSLGLAENKTVPLGQYGIFPSSIYGIWGYGQNYVASGIGGHVTGAEFDVYEGGGDAGHYTKLGTNINKALSTAAWFALPDSICNATAAIGIVGAPKQFHTGVLICNDSIVATDGSNDNEALLIQGATSALGKYNVLTVTKNIKNGLDFKNAIVSGYAIGLAANQKIAWGTAGYLYGDGAGKLYWNNGTSDILIGQ